MGVRRSSLERYSDIIDFLSLRCEDETGFRTRRGRRQRQIEILKSDELAVLVI